MRPLPRLPALLLAAALALSLASAPAAAQPAPADLAAAEALFNEAHRLLEAGNLDEACPKFLESHRLDPAAGTLLNLGDCLERAGLTASAWGAFQEALALARRTADGLRAAEAERRASALEPRLSRLTIQIPAQPAGRDLQITRDGRQVGPGLWGTAVPVDPGEHAVEAGALGRETWRGKVLVPPGAGTTVVTVPALRPLQAPPQQPPPPAPPPSARFWSAQRIAGAALGGVGLVGGVVGAVFGGRAASRMSDSEALCREGEPDLCQAPGLTLREEADSAATASTIAFVIGGVALAGGVALFATAGPGKAKPATTAVRVGAAPGAASLTLSGRW